MGRIFAALYSTFAYLLFLGTFVHAIGFVENIMVRKTIDSGAAGGATGAILVDLALLGVFAVQHLRPVLQPRVGAAAVAVATDTAAGVVRGRRPRHRHYGVVVGRMGDGSGQYLPDQPIP